MSFAEKTTVSVDSSRAELSKLLWKTKGVTACGFEETPGQPARCVFKLHGVPCAIEVPIPTAEEISAERTYRTRLSNDELLERELRRRWRVLVLLVKAKLEAIELGATTLENEFLANVVLKGGRLLGDVMRPQVEAYVQSGHLPNLLESGERGR